MNMNKLFHIREKIHNLCGSLLPFPKQKGLCKENGCFLWQQAVIFKPKDFFLRWQQPGRQYVQKHFYIFQNQIKYSWTSLCLFS